LGHPIVTNGDFVA